MRTPNDKFGKRHVEFSVETSLTEFPISYYCRCPALLLLLINPFIRTAVPFWGLSPKRDCGSEWVKDYLVLFSLQYVLKYTVVTSINTYQVYLSLAQYGIGIIRYCLSLRSTRQWHRQNPGTALPGTYAYDNVGRLLRDDEKIRKKCVRTEKWEMGAHGTSTWSMGVCVQQARCTGPLVRNRDTGPVRFLI